VADTPIPLIERLKDAEMLHASRGDVETAALLGESAKGLKELSDHLIEAAQLVLAIQQDHSKAIAVVGRMKDAVNQATEWLVNHECGKPS
jgi:hypothetical protein